MYKLLLVDDNTVFRRVLADLLASQFPAVLVEEAGDGAEALSRVARLRPNFIIMDIDLPGENGLELTRKIKGMYDSIEILILSAHDFPEYRQQAGRYGADFFQAKGGDNCLSEVLSRIDGAMVSHAMTGE